MGVIAETFRKQKGVTRSSHPYWSFAAWGAQAQTVVRSHELANGMGDGSSLARSYDLMAPFSFLALTTTATPLSTLLNIALPVPVIPILGQRL